MKNLKDYLVNESIETIKQFNKYLSKYNAKLHESSFEASSEAFIVKKDIPNNEEYPRIVIDCVDEWDSKEFTFIHTKPGDDRAILVQTDQEPDDIEEYTLKSGEKLDKSSKGYLCTENNAKILASCL